VEAGLRPEKTVKLFKDAMDRSYVHIKFTKTRGGTELGVRLDREACDFSQADFDQGRGARRSRGSTSGMRQLSSIRRRDAFTSCSKSR